MLLACPQMCIYFSIIAFLKDIWNKLLMLMSPSKVPILVKVNCELNGSFALRMYLYSECNVSLIKPAR